MNKMDISINQCLFYALSTYAMYSHAKASIRLDNPGIWIALLDLHQLKRDISRAFPAYHRLQNNIHNQ